MVRITEQSIQSSAYKDSVTEVVINLRLPSMLHGKKGFERIVWAFKNVLNHSVTWLFHDFEKPSECEAKIALSS